MFNKITIILALLAAIACGCGKKSTYKTRDGEVTVNKNGSEVTIESKTKDGNVKMSSNAAGVALPDDFPKDVPIYKGAVPQMATTQGKMMMVHFNSSAPVADILKFYQEQLKEQGWEIQTTMNIGEGSMLSAKKGERECTATVMKQDKGSMIQLTVAQKGA
jgi:hypothetical protein